MSDIVVYPPNCIVTLSTLKYVDREDIMKRQHEIPFREEEEWRENAETRHNVKQKRSLIKERINKITRKRRLCLGNTTNGKRPLIVPLMKIPPGIRVK